LEEFKARYRGSLYLESVLRSSTAGKLIRAHRAKHRSNLKDELIQEYERQQLLKSLDPEDVKRGKAMVTPATVFASVQASADTIAPVEVEEADDQDVDGSTDVADDTDGEDVADIMESSEAEEGTVAANPMAKRVMGGLSPKMAEEIAANGLDNPDPENYFENKLMGRKVQKPKDAYERIWLPISFPPVPEKGDFDVRQLKSSKYFFS
jgi:DNA-directed RNA polymerase